MAKQILNTKLANSWKMGRKERFEAVTFEGIRPLTFKEVLHKYRIGLYCSVIALMLLTIFLLGYKIHSGTKGSGNFIVLNMMTDIPVQPKEETAAEAKEQLSKEVDELIRNARSTPLRNVVVNTEDAQQSSALKDDKGINSSVYDEARQLQERLDANRREQETYQATADAVPVKAPEVKAQAQSYQGPSVLSFTLAGRKAISVPIPAYKCLYGGDVVVIVKVNRRGYVVAAEVDSRRSAADAAMREAAKEAAMKSRFTADDKATDPQQGEIVYRFIAQ